MKSHNQRCSSKVFVLAAALSLITGGAIAQGRYPSKPIRIVVPFAAGGSPDTWTRILVKGMEPRLGQPLLVENRPGANSVVGVAYGAKAAPDGYTILYATNSGISAARALFKSLPYDPMNDFAGIIIAQESYFALMVRNEEKGVSLPAFLEKIRKNPEKYPIGGASSTQEILNKMMEGAGKLSHTYARYANPAPMVSDLLGGRLGGIIHTLNASLAMVEGGQAHAIAVSSPTRLPTLPNTPALAEVMPGVSLGPWTGYFAPAKTPRPIIDLLYQKFAEAVKEPAAAKYAENSGRGIAMPPAEVDAFIRKDEARWLRLAKEAGIEPE